ncbi:MAG: hypothetical protein LBQ27_01055, partial [Clostridiales bacterium]|nr:hypothetical protein [Clostridiales bacterium]
GKIFSADYIIETKNDFSESVADKILSMDNIIHTNRNGKEKNIRPFIYSIKKEDRSLKINIDSTNLRADTVTAKIQEICSFEPLNIVKTVQYVKLGENIVNADYYLTELAPKHA